jgi:hypothetical protein
MATCAMNDLVRKLSVQYFGSYFDNLHRISDSEYIASEQDVLRSRVRTSGIVEEAYIIDSVSFV